MKSHRRWLIRFGIQIGVGLFILLLVHIALADPPVAISTSYQIFMDNVATFGKTASTSYLLDVTVGEPTLGGEVASTSYKLGSGYLPPTDPDVAISKTVTPTTATPGQWITYTITFSNTGTALASGVVITDIVPVSVTNTSVISSGVTITQTVGVTYSWQVQDLAADQGGVITITGQLSATLAMGTFTNTAVITTTTTVDGEPGNNSSDAGVTVVAPDLEVSKANTVGGATTLGNTWDWRMDVTNNGSATATFASGETIFSDTLPSSGVSYAGATVSNPVGIAGTGTINCGLVVNVITCVANGGTVTIDPTPGGFWVTTTATPSTIGAKANPTGGVCCVDPDAHVMESDETDNDCNSDTVTVTAPDLAITKVVYPATANPGAAITYTITFSNTGAALASGVVITDVVPVSVTNTSVISSGVTITQTVGVTYSWQVQDLAADQGGVITITGQLSTTLATGTFTNTAVITTTTVDANPSNNSSDAGVTVMAADDGDGVPDDVEDGAPNGGDGNNDGIPDSQQGNVASLPNAADGRYVTLVSPPGTDLADVQAVDTPADAPADVAFPVGLFQFTVPGLAPGGATAVTLLLPAGLTVDTYYKHGPNPPGGAVQWYEFLFEAGSGTGANIGAGQVVLSFVDGRRGDDLAGLDGQVDDQGGPGAPPPVPVGGHVVPVNKLELVALRLSSGQAPWMGLGALVAVGAVGGMLLLRRRQR